MLALGNDIVDLLERPKNGTKYFQRRLKYAANVSELPLLSNISCELKVRSGLVWAIKESAYKSSNKLGNRQRFNPKLFTISALSIEGKIVAGEVYYKETALIVEGSICPTHLHVWTSLSPSRVKADCTVSSMDGSAQSFHARQLALDSGGFTGAVVIKDVDGIPWIHHPARKKLELSLSHHGSYVACAHQI